MNIIPQKPSVCEITARKQLSGRLLRRASKTVARAFLGDRQLNSATLIYSLGLRNKRRSVQREVLQMVLSAMAIGLAPGDGGCGTVDRVLFRRYTPSNQEEHGR